MSDQATKKDLDLLQQGLENKINKAVEKAVDDLTEVIGQFAHSVQGEITELKNDIAHNTDAIDKLASTLDGFASRIENQEIETAASDARFEKLLSWARDVSKKTGIPLKDL